MKIITDTRSIGMLQNVVHKLGDEVEADYLSLCEAAFSKQSRLTRWTKIFKFPPSLRMFHRGEYFLEGEELTEAKYLRKVWHNCWGILNSDSDFSSCYTAGDIIHLDSYESEIVLTLAKYFKVEINTYPRGE